VSIPAGKVGLTWCLPPRLASKRASC
jgi:hypothetical protein